MLIKTLKHTQLKLISQVDQQNEFEKYVCKITVTSPRANKLSMPIY